MAQQGKYPIGSRVLAALDTLTGVVTGATADVPLSALMTFILTGVNTAQLAPTRVTSLNGGALAGLRNLILNGCMRAAQYGSIALTNNIPAYGGCDRWLSTVSGTTGSGTVAQATSLQGITQSGMAQRAVVTTTGASTFTFQQRIERFNTMGLNGKTLILSGKIFQRTGSAQTLSLSLDRANTNDNFGSLVSLNSTFQGIPNNTWTPISLSVALGPNDANTGLAVTLQFFGMAGLAGAIFMLGDVQYEVAATVNPVATSFEQRPYGMELALCQRYYESGIGLGAQGLCQVGASLVSLKSYATVKRTFPTLTYSNTTYVGTSSLATFVSSLDMFMVAVNGTSALGNANFFTNWTATAEL
jgi:hypothetical protein